MESNNEQLTNLPDNWFIKCDEYNENLLNKYFHSIGKKYSGYSKSWSIRSDYQGYYFYPQNKHYNCWGIFIENLTDYTEITFEQFEMWVLNKNNERIYELW